jgi:DNA-binding response OmpR family regulator
LQEKLEKLKSLKILFVEDEDSLRDIISGTLTKLGANFDVATNGMDGLSKIQTNDYDLVVTDINMPKMNGLDMIDKIKNELKIDVPVYIMSAHTNSAFKDRAAQLGVDKYMMKPFDFIKFINLTYGLEEEE